MPAVLLLLVGLLTFVAPPGGVVFAAVSPGVTERLSVRNDGSPAAGSNSPSTSSDGRYTAFVSSASLDSTLPTTHHDIFVRDRVSGTTVAVTRGQVTNSSGAVVAETDANGDSSAPSISADGRYVAFLTAADNFNTTDTDTLLDVVIVDRDPTGTGHFDQMTPGGFMNYRYVYAGRAHIGDGGRDIGDREGPPSLDANADAVAWQDYINSTVVVTTLTKDAAGDIAVPTPASFNTLAATATGSPNWQMSFNGAGDIEPVLSGNGRYLVAKASVTINGQPMQQNGIVDIDLVTNQQTRMDITSDGQPILRSPGAEAPTVSQDGRIVAFFDFVGTPGTSQYAPRVWAIDRDPNRTGTFGPGNGATFTATEVSADGSGAEQYGTNPALSADGRFLAFVTTDPGLYDGSPGGAGVENVVVRDLVADAQRRQQALPWLPGELASASVNQTCSTTGQSCPGNAPTTAAAVSANGGVVVLGSLASDLAAGPGPDGSGGEIYARTFTPGLTVGSPAVTFPLTLVGDTSTTATATFTYTGFGPLPVTGVAVTGADPGDFTVLPASTCRAATVLYGSGSCQVSVQFAPQAAGNRSAVIAVSAGGSLFTANLTGQAQLKSVMAHLDVNQLDFGTVQVNGQGTPHTVTLTNTGNVPLQIDRVSLPADTPTMHGLFPGDYAITADKCTGTSLAPGATCQVTVLGNPRSAGVRPAVLQFDDSAAGSPQLLPLTMTGTGGETIKAGSALGPPGSIVRVTGTQFPPNTDVTVGFLGFPETVTVRTGADGSLSAQLPVFPKGTTGPRTIVATSADGTARMSYLVVPGTLIPPDFVNRH